MMSVDLERPCRNTSPDY